MARPRKKRADPLAAQSMQLETRVSLAQAEMVRQLAAAEGLSVASWLRSIVLPIAEEHHAELLAREPK